MSYKNRSECETNSVVSNIIACRSFATMGLYPTQLTLRIDGMMLDTGSNYFSTIGNPLVNASIVASVRKTNPFLKTLKPSEG